MVIHMIISNPEVMLNVEMPSRSGPFICEVQLALTGISILKKYCESACVQTLLNFSSCIVHVLKLIRMA